MDARWQRIEQIFHEASELDGTARGVFLDQACGGDAALRAEVESLLAADGHGQAIFSAAVSRVTETIPDDGAMEGKSVGPYTIDREVGRGGMGAVYLAHRKGDFSKRVAIKIVKRGMDTDQIVQRFRQERQILANLEHPNIARLLDGGATEDGRPYLVMEYVEGKPITRYCAEANLALRQKLELFLQVCDGVLCAHRNLAIHRDLKPGNILVNSEGIVKLLDFGIAKLLDPDASGETAPRTIVGTPMLTPDYASPEQVRGLAVSVSTDVYSLGAVLYELLCGHTPHHFESQSAAEIERVICEGGIPPMGIGARELESIAAMALRKEPERRYASVEQLADDIRRYLDGRPVLAFPDSFRYRATRWIKRHRTAAIAAAIAVIGLLSGLAVALYQAQVARSHAARAERRFNEVRKLAKAILFEHYDLIRELPGTTRAKESMARVSQEYLNSLAGEADDPQLILELANAYRRLAEVQGAPGAPNLGQAQQAIANFRKAIELFDRLPAPQWNNPQVLDASISALWRLSRIMQNEGKYDEATQLATRQTALAQRLYELQPNGSNAAFQYLTAQRALSTLALRRGDVAAAVRNAERAVELGDQIVRENATPQLLGAKAANYQVLAESVWKQGNLPRARELYEKYVQLFADLAARKPDEQYFTHSLYYGHLKLGKIHAEFHRLNLGDSVKAESHCREYLNWAQRMLQADPADALAQESINFGRVCTGVAIAVRKPKDALPYLQDALRASLAELERRPRQVARVNAAFIGFVLADIQAAAGLRSAALDSFAKSMRLYDSLDKEKLSTEDRTDLMLANRQYAKLTGDVSRARTAVSLTNPNGKLQELIHAAEARETLAQLSAQDRCPALREAAALRGRARTASFGTPIVQALPPGDCVKP
ncbi:MAG: serine/threonine protein kinase [Acidobacteria bacterium]|nr:serine/threonine protein kinase [Acidobacteriota bacterium]